MINKKCFYTDKILVLGINASVDHVIPKCKGGTHNIENLAWIDRDINTIKNKLTHDEFIELCKFIYNKFGEE